MVQLTPQGDGAPPQEEEKPRVPLRDVPVNMPDATTQFDIAMFGRSMGATFDRAMMDNTFSQGVRLFKHLQMEDQFEGQNVKSKDELNEMFPIMNGEFKEDLPLAYAEELVRNRERERELEAKMAQGPQNFFTKTAGFATSFIPHIIDPINLAADFIGIGLIKTGIGITKSVQGARAAVKARRAFALSASQQGAFATFRRGAQAGVLGNAIVEPVTFASFNKDLKDRKAGDAMLDILVGGTAFPAIGLGLTGLSKLGFGMPEIRKGAGQAYEKIRNLGDGAEEAAHVTAAGQLAQGKRSDLDGINRQHVKALDSKIDANTSKLPDDIKNKAGHPIHAPTDVPKATFFAVPQTAGVEVPGKFRYSSGRHIDGTKSYTASVDEANALAAHPLSNHSQAIEYKIDTDKLIDLNKPVDDAVALRVLSVLPEQAAEQLKQLNLTYRQAFDQIERMIRSGDLNEGADEIMNQAAKDLGFDGYIEKVSSELGQPITPRTVVRVFDNKVPKVESEVSRFKPDDTQVAQMAPDEIQSVRDKALSEESDLLPNQKKKAHQQVFEDNPPRDDITEAEVTKETQARLDTLDEIERMGALSKEDAEELTNIRKNIADIDKFDEFANNFERCIRG